MPHVDATSPQYHPQVLREAYAQVRKLTERLVAPLTPEDCVLQSMPDASPTRWHLAHTTWFFETFILKDQLRYQVFAPEYEYLFNSYYNAVGAQFPRAQRGLMSRPGLNEIMRYRSYVDDHICRWLDEAARGGESADRQLQILEVGLHHEQQHQELIVTDIKHLLSLNPLQPAYHTDCRWVTAAAGGASSGTRLSEGIYRIGHLGRGFAFDNESPPHRVVLEPCWISNQLVTCGEYQQFMEAGGYERPELWLALGWDHVRQHRWQAPLYWLREGGEWQQFTLAGFRPIDRQAPVCHVSFFEADAFARWAGKRLPTEAEWECFAVDSQGSGEQFLDRLLETQRAVHPVSPEPTDGSPSDVLGTVWEWTASPYLPYPGFRASAGALGEYNGKFMTQQYVLRGGSCATPSNHIRATYRNFFPPQTRWQFAGIRLAQGTGA